MSAISENEQFMYQKQTIKLMLIAQMIANK